MESDSNFNQQISQGTWPKDKCPVCRKGFMRIIHQGYRLAFYHELGKVHYIGKKCAEYFMVSKNQLLNPPDGIYISEIPVNLNLPPEPIEAWTDGTPFKRSLDPDLNNGCTPIVQSSAKGRIDQKPRLYKELDREQFKIAGINEQTIDLIESLYWLVDTHIRRLDAILLGDNGAK